MRVRLCGVRGSTPAPGPAYDRYGGHTSCVAVAADGAAPTLLLDAGTGLREVPALLGGQPFAGTILLTHLHWDHWQGLPFFGAGFLPGARVDVRGPAQPGDPVEVLSGIMRPPYFPITPEQLGDGWTFDWIEPGRLCVEGFDVLVREIPHKGGRTIGYRITDGRSTLAYVTDHGPSAWSPGEQGDGVLHDAALELADGADVLVHDAQHVAAEFPRLAFLGHSTVEYAVRLAESAGVGRLVLFHHDPTRTDDQIDDIVAGQRGAAVPVEAGRQGRVFDLPAAPSAAPVAPAIGEVAAL
ncbi:MAG TPA: MBL fold metallo-hydrolase [Mycobacteriales bacterium]|jgi:phosphoribosyl 1,2-cyclic phosphodiesterase|nr:MBL fold metallo-hydrolase [Mycobacteriales bacterium]